MLAVVHIVQMINHEFYLPFMGNGCGESLHSEFLGLLGATLRNSLNDRIQLLLIVGRGLDWQSITRYNLLSRITYL